MKRLITIAFAAACCFAAYGKTDAQLTKMLESKQYAEFVSASTDTQFTNLTTKAIASDVLDAAIAMTNTWKASLLYASGTVSTNEVLKKMIASEVHKNAKAAICKATKYAKSVRLDVWNEVLLHSNVLASDDVTKNLSMCIRNDLVMENPELFIQTANAVKEKNRSLYVYFLFANAVNTEKNAIVSDHLYSVYKTASLADVQSTFWGWNLFKEYDRRNDKIWICKDEFFPQQFIQTQQDLYIGNAIASLKKAEVYRDRVIAQYAKVLTDPKLAYLYGSRVSNEMLSQLFDVIKKDPACAIKAAVKLGSPDKVIDALKASTDNLDPEVANGAIKVLNGIDNSYRKEEVVTILSNINSKYTLKLYDDKAAWDPIISKVRAMIEVRQ